MPSSQERPIVIGLNAVIVAVTDEVPLILTVRRREDGRFSEALPFGPLDPDGDRTMELGLRGWVREQTGIEVGYVEQLYTFADRHRDPSESKGGPRVISVAYLALVRQSRLTGVGAHWQDWYPFLPWEDWRQGRPPVIDRILEPGLRRWAESASSPSQRDERNERVDITFGLHGSPWDTERVLERFELMYESGLAAEARRDRSAQGLKAPSEGRRDLPGQSLVMDHRRILATAMGRLRGKLKYRPVVFELVPETFTLLQLQRVVEALAGVRLHKQNFRRLVEKGGLVEGTGDMESHTGGRPAELFRFRREVLRERPAPGVGLPRSSSLKTAGN